MNCSRKFRCSRGYELEVRLDWAPHPRLPCSHCPQLCPPRCGAGRARPLHSLVEARRPGPRSARSRPHSDLHPEACDLWPRPGSCPPSSQQVSVPHLAAPSALLLMPYPLIPVVPLSVSPVTVLPYPSHQLSPPACPHLQDTPKKSCVYRSGYSFSRGCSYTCAKKIQVCLEPSHPYL